MKGNKNLQILNCYKRIYCSSHVLFWQQDGQYWTKLFEFLVTHIINFMYKVIKIVDQLFKIYKQRIL